MSKIQPFKIIKDTREQEGYTFEPSSSRYHKCEGMVVRKLDTGDYSLEGLEDKVCIERKASVVEFANNVGHDAVRFAKEIERMKKFPSHDRTGILDPSGKFIRSDSENSNIINL